MSGTYDSVGRCGGDPVVSLLPFYLRDRSSNLAGQIFFCKIVVEKNENKHKKRPQYLAYFKNKIWASVAINTPIRCCKLRD